MYLYEITIMPLLVIIFTYYIKSKFLHYYISKMTSHKSEKITFIISIYFLYSFVLYIRKKKNTLVSLSFFFFFFFFFLLRERVSTYDGCS